MITITSVCLLRQTVWPSDHHYCQYHTMEDSDYDHPYHETACEWYHHHVLRRARRLAGVTSSSDSSSCSSSSSDSRAYNNEGLEQEGANTKLLSLGNYIRSAKRPLTRWMASYPLVAARCCLSIQGTYNSNPRLNEATRLRRVFQRLHRKHIVWQKKMKYGNSESQSFHHPTSSTSIMSLDQQLLRIKQETIDTESNRMAIQSFLPQGTGIPFIDAVLGSESLQTTPAPLERTKEECTTRYQTTSRLVLELVRMERFSQYIVLPLLTGSN